METIPATSPQAKQLKVFLDKGLPSSCCWYSPLALAAMQGAEIQRALGTAWPARRDSTALVVPSSSCEHFGVSVGKVWL